MSLAVNLITSFSLYVQALTIPGMKNTFELTYTTVFILVVALSLSRVVSGLVSGTLASRYGGRWMIITSIFAQAASMALLGWSPNYWVALAAMIVVGVASGAALTPMMGMLSPWFRINDRGMAAGIAASGGSLAIVFTGLIVPPLTNLFGDDAWRYTWYVLAATSVLLGFLCVSFIRPAPPSVVAVTGARITATPTSVAATSVAPATTAPDTPTSAAPIRRGPASWPVEVYTNPYVWLITGMAFCSGFIHGILTASYGAYLGGEHGISVATVGVLFMTIGVLSIGSGVVSGTLSDKAGRGMAFGATFLLEAASHALFWLMPELVFFIIASVLAGMALRATYTILCGGGRRLRSGVHGAGVLRTDGHGGRHWQHHLASHIRPDRRRHRHAAMVLRHGHLPGVDWFGVGVRSAFQNATPTAGNCRPSRHGSVVARYAFNFLNAH